MNHPIGKLASDLRLARTASISAVLTLISGFMISRYYRISSLELVGVFAGLLIIVGTFRWALFTEDEQPSDTEVEMVPDITQRTDRKNLAVAHRPPERRQDLSQADRQKAPSTSIPEKKSFKKHDEVDFYEIPFTSTAAPGEKIPARTKPGSSNPIKEAQPTTPSARFSLRSEDIESQPLLELHFRGKSSGDLTGKGSAKATDDPVWCGKGKTAVVGRYKLSDALVYTYDGRSDPVEASCIDLRLPIGRPEQEPRGSLGYYPTYSRLTSGQRANYLRWLADGRTGPLNDIGYAFLYFYGLERRLLVEGQDLSPIVKETVRLLETYDFSGSFDGYLSRFLSYSLAKSGIGALKEKWFKAIFEKSRTQRDEQQFAVGLAWFYLQQRPLPAHWAMRVAKLDPRSPRSVVLDRLPEQFRVLFAKRYEERFGEGMLLRAAKRDREVIYRPANPSLIDGFDSLTVIEPVRVPNVPGIQSQFEPLVRIWSSCIEELKPLNRVIAKGAEVTTRAVYEALPKHLKAETEHPDKALWERLTTEYAREDGSVVMPAGSLASTQGIEERPKLTAKQSTSLANTAHEVGFMIEPDFRITGQPYKWNDSVALLRPEERPSLPADGRYAGAALMLELGMYVAASDGEIEGEEVNHIASFLESQFLLDPQDVRRLEALKQVFLNQHPSINGIGKRLKATLSAEQLESVGEFLIGIAASNGSIDKKEISALRTAYRALGIEAKTLDRLLDDHRRRTMEPVLVQSGTVSADSGETIPNRESKRTHTVFRLDPVLLERLMHETRQVGTLLDEAMQDEAEEERFEVPEVVEGEQEAAEQVVEKAIRKQFPAPGFEGLETRHSALLAELRNRPSWPRAEFEELVRGHSLMPSGAIDRINEWAHESFDDPILEEDGDQLIVHTELLTEE